MATVQKIRITRPVGDPSTGVTLQPGVEVDVTDVWAKRFVRNGVAVCVGEPRIVEEKPIEKPWKKKAAAETDAEAPKAEAKKPAAKGKKKHGE